MKQQLLEEGCEFFKDTERKLRYVGIYGNRREKRILRNALRWPVLPYVKRQPPSATIEVPAPDGFDLNIPSSPTVAYTANATDQFPIAPIS